MTSLNNFGKTRILVVGDVMLDRYWWGKVERISPEAPVPVITHQRTSSVPGGAANVAINVASLGGEAILVSVVGDDDEAVELAGVLDSSGVASKSLLRISRRKTAVKTRIIAHNQQVARLDVEDVSELTDDEEALILRSLESVIEATDLVLLSDYAKGTLTKLVIERLLKIAKQAGKPVLVDPKGRDFSKYRGATILTPNRLEAAEACGLDESSPELVRMAGELILRETGFAHVLITEGENGMTLFSQAEGPFHMDATARQVYDVTGAGDSVIACLGVAIAAGLDIRDACRLANIAGGISVQHVGTHAVTLETLKNSIQADPGPAGG